MVRMALLHETGYRTEIEQRIRLLRADSRGRWGRMSVDQMLWHMSEVMRTALGEQPAATIRTPLPRGLMKAVVLTLPWVKNAPTHPSFRASVTYDFAEQQARCLALVEQISGRSLDVAWPAHPMFGPMTGREVSRLMAKHLE